MGAEQVVVTWTYDGGCPVVHLAGEVDLATASDCFDAVKAGVNGGGGVVVDLTAVTFIDSTGLRGLLELQRVCQVRLVVPVGQARRLMTISGLDKVFEIFSSTDAAQRHADTN